MNEIFFYVAIVLFPVIYLIGTIVHATTLDDRGEKNMLRLWGGALIWPLALGRRIVKDYRTLRVRQVPSRPPLADYVDRAEQEKPTPPDLLNAEPHHEPYEWMN